MNLVRNFLLLAVLCGLPLVAQADTAALYRDAKDKIYQIRILESDTGTRTAYGSGFAADDKGHVVTNFHVVSDLVDRPNRYHIETVDPAGQHLAATLVAFDAVSDLAVVQLPTPPQRFMTLETVPMEQGARLYSIGLPLDQDFTVSEGTYNGLLPQVLTPRIHFTGALNSGMSGGPAINDQGHVVGVNVTTMGNSVGHLVPAAPVQKLLAGAGREALSPQAAAVLLTQQLTQHQASYMKDILAARWPRVKLGPYSVPGQIAPWLKCWANTSRVPTNLFESVDYTCDSSEDSTFVSERLETSTVALEHTLIKGRNLGRQRFAWLMSDQTKNNWGTFGGAREDAGNFRCQDGVVKNDGLVWNTRLCTRALRKLPGLYDAALQMVTLNPGGTGLVSQLKVQGASYDNILRLSRQFTEQITWTH